MARAAAGAALLVIALLVAGCVSQQAPSTASSPAATPANSTVPVDDGSAASKAAAATMAEMPHVHDYWQGRERVTLFDGDLQPDPENVTFATLFQAVSGRPGAVGGQEFSLPDGKTVYEGTGRMDLTATWSDPRVTGVSFIYKSAANGDYQNGGRLENAKTFQLPVTPPMTDMPHAKSSKWWFGFGPDPTPGALAGPWHLRIDIVRMYNVSLFPAHPDFWGGKDTLVLLDATHHGQVDSYAKRSTEPATQGNFTEDWVSFAHVVPMETTAVTLTVTITSASSTPGQVTAFGLFYHGADTQNPFRCPVKPISSLPSTLSWTVPSTMQMTDSPYANHTDWRFLVEPQVTPAPGAPQMGGMTDVTYDYHVVATALQNAPQQMDACKVDASSG